jgi:hypothetical protein
MGDQEDTNKAIHQRKMHTGVRKQTHLLTRTNVDQRRKLEYLCYMVQHFPHSSSICLAKANRERSASDVGCSIGPAKK